MRYPEYDNPSLAPGYEDAGGGEEAGLGEYAARLWRRRWLIAAILLPAIAVSAFLASRAEPTYTAVARLRLGVQAPRVEPFAPAEERAEPRHENMVQTQINIFQNRTIARRVVEDLNYKPEPSPGERLKRKVKTMLGGARITPADVVGTDARREGAIDSFLAGLTVVPVGDTQIFEARYSSTDPAFSAKALNALCDAYLKHDFETKAAAYAEAQRWLQGKLNEVKSSLARSEDALYRYAGADGSQFMTLSDGGLQYMKELDELRLKISALEDEQAGVRADRDRLAAGGLPDDAAGAGGISLASQLRAQLAAADVELEKARQTLGPLDSTYKNAAAARERLAGQFGQEKKRLLDGANLRLAQVTGQLAGLRGIFDERQRRVIALQQRLSGYNTLKREVDLNREIYNNLLQKWQEVSIGQSIQPADAVIMQKAERPLAPIHRDRNNILLYGCLLGLALSIGAAWAADRLDTTLKSSEEIWRLTGLETLGHIAPCPADGRKIHPGLAVYERPASDVARSFRALRASIEFLSGRRAPGRILVTSAVAGEGKTTVALNLATSFAQKGRSVLLIDAGLQSGALHGIFDLKQDHGLAELLASGRSDPASIEEFVTATRVPRLHVIPSGAPVAHAADLLDTGGMGQVLESLDGRFDHIVIDAESFGSLAEAGAMAPHVDAVLVVARPGRTRRADFMRLIRMLAVTGARVLGVVLNNSRSDLDLIHFRQDGHGIGTREQPWAETGGRRRISDHIAAATQLDGYYDI